MIFFPDTTLHRYTLTQESTGVYGEPRMEYQYADDITCDFQNDSNMESANTYGVELADLYKIYIDKDTPLGDTDHLVSEDGTEYHIVGGIQDYTNQLSYKKAQLVRQRHKRGITTDASQDDNQQQSP